MNRVTVQYGGVKILENVDWTVRAGEKWALLGPNGSGKSTLLSLINGDNPQAYANDILLFDRKKGSGESIWEIKRQIGFVSPELHAYFPKSTTCFEAVASGFRDTLHLGTELTGRQTEIAEAYLHLLQLDALRDTPLWRLSAGETRLALVARALVKAPPLLILDEPCQGLDAQYGLRIRTLLERTCAHSGQTMIYVTHYAQEIPDCVTRVLRLDGGKVRDLETR
jgi:molybdate transport system ATP-binding protein